MSDFIDNLRRQWEQSWDRRSRDDLHASFARLYAEKLMDIAEAAEAYLDVPRRAEKDPDGVILFDFKPQQQALKNLEEKLAALRSES